MQKKHYIGVTLVTAVIVFAALTGSRAWRLGGGTDDSTLENGLYSSVQTIQGERYLIPADEIYASGLTAEYLAPVNDPVFASVAQADLSLADELLGIAIEVDGEQYFYPYQILDWHGVVNDTIGERHLAVTYDTLTGSAVVYERGDRLFAPSGKVYNNNMLLDDGAGNLWLQLRGAAVVGDAAGEQLTQYPSQSIRWDNWKDEYPDGQAMIFPEGTGKDYRVAPYGAYRSVPDVYFPLNHIDTAVSPKRLVDGVVLNDGQTAFVRTAIALKRTLATTVGATPVVGFYDATTEVPNIFVAKAGETALTFAYDAAKEAFIDNETGSTWNASGYAINGELQGTQLTLLNAQEAYWFAWSAMYPKTTVAGQELANSEGDDITEGNSQTPSP